MSDQPQNTQPTMVLVSEDDTIIVGTLERLRARAGIIPGSARLNEAGGIEFEYSGKTTVLRDEYEAAMRNEPLIFLDEEGNEWSESQLHLVPSVENTAPPDAAPPSAITITMEGGVIHEVEGIPGGIVLRVFDLDIEGVEPERLTLTPWGEQAYLTEWSSEDTP